MTNLRMFGSLDNGAGELSLKVLPNDGETGSLVGPDTLNANVSFASVAAQTIIAAPGLSKRLRIVSLRLMSAVDVVVAIVSGSTTMGTYLFSMLDLNFDPHVICGENEAFKLDAVSADQIYGHVQYIVEDI
jgi:hypothetical protein